ncbi:MAG: RNA methyltransferase [Tissierellaceae bacterium]
MQVISSIKNPLIKNIRSLHRRRERFKNKAFIIEGIKVVAEALEQGYPIRNIIYTDQLLAVKDGEELFKKIQDLPNTIYVADKVFKEISDTENPQGLLAIAEMKNLKIEEIKMGGLPFLIYLNRLQDPGNMGTIIRTADAFKADGIIIGQGSVDPYNPKVVRATMGSIFRLPIIYEPQDYEDLEHLKARGLHIYSSSLEGSRPIYHIDFQRGFVLVIGNESNGIDEKIAAMSHSLIKVPMPGGAESLNAGIAASIIMYEAMKQRANNP